MFKFIGKALAGLVLTKEAREAANQLAVAKGLLPKSPPADDEPAAEDLLSAATTMARAEQATPDRAELIKQAMKVRAAKQVILADLDDATRAKLVAVAMKAMLNEGREKE
ncbi:MAG TPA: hypothetical protein HPQ04_00245 [Rhodospirillaceae bacterium]|nr:hypothetical protein [Rhodospirillaceae bacterium]